MRHLAVTLAALCIAAACLPAGAVDVTFDVPADNDLFSKLQQAQYTPIAWSAASGIAGGGGLNVTGSHKSTFAAASFDASQVGAVLESSTFFRTKDPGPITPGLSVTYADTYLVRDSTMYGGNFANSFQTTVRENSDAVELGGTIWQGASGSGWSTPFPQGIIQPDRWYQLKTQFQNIGLSDFNWHIQLNDYGPTGDQFVAVAETRNNEWDLYRYLTDASLYAGFGATSRGVAAVDNFSASTSVTPIPTASLDLFATYDVELKVAASTTTIIEGGQGIRLGFDGTPGNPTSEALLEFPLDALPEGARVLSATLTLSPNIGIGTPLLQVRGFEGDGLASISDASASYATLHPSFTIDFTSYSIPLDPLALEFLVDSPSHLGIRITNLASQGSMFINAKEYPFQTPDNKITLNYYVPPPGDFDVDSNVDRDDLTLWRRAFGVTNEASVDGDNDSDGADFLAWQRNFGAAFAASPAESQVPEPAGPFQVCLAAFFAAANRRRVRAASC
jgi:hypothetical protein